MLGETEKSSDVCRTASLSEMGHEQRAATSSTVTDERRKNFFVCRLKVNVRQDRLIFELVCESLLIIIIIITETSVHTTNSKTDIRSAHFS